MSDTILKKIEDLVTQGSQLVPMGGFEFSGYNARLQNKYLEWRKACLEALEQVGPIGFSYKTKILGDSNGGYFFQSSAQLIVNTIKDLSEKLKASPDLASSAGGGAPAAAPGKATVIETGGARVIKPPPKAPAPQDAGGQPKAAPAGGGKKVYVVGEDNDPLRQQLSDFLRDVGLEEVSINRQHGTMVALEKIKAQPDIRYAFFVFNPDDLAYAMFELGHFVGQLGPGRVTVLHMTDVDFPKNVPGINHKRIVVKLEEASLSILKELKAAGFQISL